MQWTIYTGVKGFIFGDFDTAGAIKDSSSPYDMVNLGKNVANFQYKVWKDHADSVVKKCNQCEFQSNAAVMEKLMKYRW